jgi:hypothetical protein
VKKIPNQIRQGDVLLVPVNSIPLDAKPFPTKGDLVLAEGEVTGHAHRVRRPGKKARLLTTGTETYLEVLEPVSLDHEEHGAPTLEPGVYHIRRQVEMWLDEVRQVAD